MDYVTIHYGRHGIYATGLEFGISIAHATLTHSLYNGLYLSSLTGVIITDSTISNNATGVYSSGSSIQMTGSTLTQNTTAVSSSAMSPG